MRVLCLALAAALCLGGCKKNDELPDSRLDKEERSCSRIDTLAQVMQCELAPYTRGQSGDEAAFRRALAQLKDLAPSDPQFFEGPRPWPAIVDSMLQSKQYKQGCAECHRAYIRKYRQRYEDSQVPWTDVHGPNLPTP